MTEKNSLAWYQGCLLLGNYSEGLRARVSELIDLLMRLEAAHSPVFPYLAAWDEDNKIIWYEFIDKRLCRMLNCTPAAAADSFRKAVVDRRVYCYSGSDDEVEEEIITHEELGGYRHGLREEVKRSGSVDAVYKISVNEKFAWLKDQATIENFAADKVCLSLGFLTDVTKEMEQKDLFEKIGYFDELTRLPKRLIMDRIFEINLGHYQRSLIDDFVFMMIDVDHFKIVNDTYGHQAGDFVLVELAELMASCKRKEDEIGRYGGEEFYCFSLGKIEHGYLFAERLRASVAGHKFVHEKVNIPITISIGLIAASQLSKEEGALSRDALIKHADTMLYSAKKNGRNQVALNYQGYTH